MRFLLLLLLVSSPGLVLALPPGAENWPAECEQNQAKSCLFHGYRLMKGDQIPKNADRATVYFSKACQLKLMDGCYHAGYNLYYGKGNVSQNLKSAIAYLSSACKGGFKTNKVCYYTGNSLLYAKGMKPRPKEALYFYSKSCRAGNGEACAFVAYLSSGNMGVERVPQRALSYAEVGCELKSGYACYNAALLLSSVDDIEKDLDKAGTYARQAVELNPKKIEHLYLSGLIHALKGEYELSTPLFSKACEGGMSDACLGLGNNVRHSDGKLSEAANWYKKACAMKNQVACTAAADLDRYQKELKAYKAQVAAYEAQQKKYKAGEAKISAALNAGDYNGAMDIATYGLGSARHAAQVLVAAENAGMTKTLDPIYFHGVSNWFVFQFPTANGIVRRELSRIAAMEKSSQRRYRVAPVQQGPKAPSSLYDQAMKFQRDSYRRNLNWYNRGGSPSDPRVYQ